MSAWYQKYMHTLASDDVGHKMIKFRPIKRDRSYMNVIYLIESVKLIPAGICKCGAIANKFCAKCNIQYYCGKECQKKNWPKHKNRCGNEIESVELIDVKYPNFGTVTLKGYKWFKNWIRVSDIGTEDEAIKLCANINTEYSFCFYGDIGYFKALRVWKNYLHNEVIMIIVRACLDVFIHNSKFYEINAYDNIHTPYGKLLSANGHLYKHYG